MTHVPTLATFYFVQCDSDPQTNLWAAATMRCTVTIATFQKDLVTLNKLYVAEVKQDHKKNVRRNQAVNKQTNRKYKRMWCI